MERNYVPIMEIQIGFAYSIARKLKFTEPVFIAKPLANPSSDFLHHTRVENSNIFLQNVLEVCWAMALGPDLETLLSPLSSSHRQATGL
jgi:hypothetical protein